MMPKINSVHYGGKWILTGLLIGAVLPAGIWFVFHVFLWGLCVIGAVILAAFVILFLLKMHQDNGPVPYYEKHLAQTIPYDPHTQSAVIHASICTGEKTARFKNRADGHFTEVMVIRSNEDLERFKRIYQLEEVKTEY